MSWVKIDNQLLRDANLEQFRELLFLLTKKINENELRFDFFFSIDPTKLQGYPHFNKLSNAEQQLIKGSILKAYNSGAKNNPKYQIENGTLAKSEFYKFNILESLYFFNQPFSIYVENNLYDKYFVKTIFKYFDVAKRVESYILKGFLSFENSGGIDGILNVLRSKQEQISEIENLNSGFPQKYLNAFVICDSDKTHPNDLIEKNINLINELEKLEVGCYMLEKRSMENYIPDVVFNDLANQNLNYEKGWVMAYNNLTSEQKDYLKYDKGFSQKIRAELKIETRNLYNTVSDSAYDILNAGIKLQSYKSNIANLFNSPLIYKAVLLQRAGGTEDNNELKTLVNKLNRFLQ